MKKTQPNILLIFTDMQRADTIAALGNPVIKTPNLDRLVREGTSFDNCFSPSPVCVPARCCMHYGKYPQSTKVFDNYDMPPDNGKSIPGILAEASYETGAIGKCHFMPDKHAMRGFKSRLTQEECCSEPESDDYCRFLADNGLDYDEPQGTRGEMYYIPQISLHDAKSHPTQWIGDRSVDFIREKSNAQAPWMLFSSFIHPHPPFAPPKPWHKLYRSPLMPLPFVPENPESTMLWINRYQNRYKYRDMGLDKNLLRSIKAYYYACISFVDYQIGRMISELEKAGELDNTLIVFSSDHGEYLGDFNCFGKRGMHDASSRVPLIVRYPERFKTNSRCSVPASLVDLMPTFNAAAEINRKDIAPEGEDLALIASGKSERKTVFSQFASGDKAVYMAVREDYKYVYSAGDNKEFFFDRKADPADSRNKAGVGMLAGIKNELKNELLSFLKSKGQTDAFEETNGSLYWKIYPLFDESFLEDPDSKLLFQDHDAFVLDESGYTK